MRQNHHIHKVSIIGTGFAKVFKYFDSRNRIQLGVLELGLYIGDQQLIFDSLPQFTVETASYCNVGVVSFHHFEEFFLAFPMIKKLMIDEVIWNPYDK